jgi:hypothetical protein
LRYLYLAHFAKPREDRILYRTIRRARPGRIVELGINTAERSLRMIQLAARYRADEGIRYTGIDWFESRDPSQAAGLTLKEAHRKLSRLPAQVKLVPGEPASALSRVANILGEVDLLLLSSEIDAESLSAAWFYFPRLLHSETIVLRQCLLDGEGGYQWQKLELLEIQRLASQQRTQRRRAA